MGIGGAVRRRAASVSALAPWATPGSGRVVFGDGAVNATGEVVESIGQRVAVVADPILADLGFVDAVRDALTSASLETVIDLGGRPEISSSLVVEAIERIERFKPDVIVGLGGGSNIDLAKLVALGISHGLPFNRWYGESKVPGATLPVVAIPTTSGTGSEVSPVAVLADDTLRTKIGISSEYLLPRAAILDPLLTSSCPPRVTADAGLDALSHAIEAVLAVDHADRPGWSAQRIFAGRNPFSDLLAFEAITLVARSLRKVYVDGSAHASRTDMMRASLLAGMAFSAAGTGVAHALQYPVGAATGTSHGMGVAMLLPTVMTHALEVRRTELEQIGALLSGGGRFDGPFDASDAIGVISELLANLDVPHALADIGFSEDQIPAAAATASTFTRLIDNSPFTATEEVLRTILTSATVAVNPQEASKPI